MSDCERYEEMISALLDGELSGGEEAEVRAHMASCPECAAMYEAFAAVGGAVGAQDVPDTLHDGIMAKVRAAEKASKTQHTIVRLRPILAAAACLIVLVGTVFALKNNLGPGSRTVKSASSSADAPAAAESYSAGALTDSKIGTPAEAPAANAQQMEKAAADLEDGVRTNGTSAVSESAPGKSASFSAGPKNEALPAAGADSGETETLTLRVEALTEDGFTGVVLQDGAGPLAGSETVTVIWEGETGLTPGMLLTVTFAPEDRLDDGRILAESVEPAP